MKVNQRRARECAVYVERIGHFSEMIADLSAIFHLCESVELRRDAIKIEALARQIQDLAGEVSEIVWEELNIGGAE